MFFKNFNIKSVPQLIVFKEESFETISGSEDIVKFIKIWNSGSGQYINLETAHSGHTVSHGA